MATLIFSALSLNAEASTDAKPDLHEFFTKANDFFEAHVSNGLVDYEAIHSNPATLNELVGLIANSKLAALDANTQKAFYINVYNLLVIKSVIDFYPINGPTDKNDFFNGVRFTVAGEKLSLDNIEKDKLLATTGDARLHFVLVCAAIGCPKLASFAYMPDQLDAQIEAQTKLALNSTYFIRVDAAKQEVLVSQIFYWYKKDFTGDGRTVLQYINQYRSTPIPNNYTVGKYDYDWSLNQKKK